MRARDGYLLALDVGTTTTRCILFDLGGTPVGEAYRESRVYHPRPNWTEVEPEDWWKSAVTVIREALQRAEVPSERILSIGLSGLMHALVPVDRSGNPLSRSMLWMDQRCQPQVEWMIREHGQRFQEITGSSVPVTTTMSAPKLRWIVENEPDLVRRADKFLFAKDFIRFRLTGTIATDLSDAGGTYLLDQRSGDWSRHMLELIGVPSDKIPPIRSSTDIAGEITEEAARETGLTPGTPVVIGGGDVRSTLVGANAFDSQRACLYLGTAAWIAVPCSGGTHNFLGATATTGAALKWLLALLEGDGEGDGPRHFGGRSYAALVQQAESVPAGARGLIFLPHLMGERGPSYNPEAKGVLFGLTLAHSRGEIARAVLEGCAFQIGWILDNSDCVVREVIAVGGGAKSALWLSIIADVTGTTLLIPRVLEAGALGAAIFAGVGVGIFRDVQHAAEEWVSVAEQVEHDSTRHEFYRSVYSLFVQLENKVASLYGQVPI